MIIDHICNKKQISSADVWILMLRFTHLDITLQVKVIVVNDSMTSVYEDSVSYDRDLPEFGLVLFYIYRSSG